MSGGLPGDLTGRADPQPAAAVDRRVELVTTGPGEVPGVAPMGREPIEPVPVDAAQQFVDRIGQALPPVAGDMG